MGFVHFHPVTCATVNGKLFKEKNIRTSHLFLCLHVQLQGPKNAPRQERTCVLHMQK